MTRIFGHDKMRVNVLVTIFLVMLVAYHLSQSALVLAGGNSASAGFPGLQNAGQTPSHMPEPAEPGTLHLQEQGKVAMLQTGMSAARNPLGAAPQKGIAFQAAYLSDFSANLYGGVQNKAVYLDNIDLTLTADLQPLLGIQNTTFFLYVLGNHGRSPMANAGDIQGTSNIEAPSVWKIYELWMQHVFLQGKLSLLLGLYDLNSEFDVMHTAGLFLNSSHGIGPDFAQTGLGGPSIFPCTSLAARIRAQPVGHFYGQIAVAQDRPPRCDNDLLEGFSFSKTEGLLLTAEFAYLHDEPTLSEAYDAKIAVGLYQYTTMFPDLLAAGEHDNPARKKSIPGFYVLAEKVIYREQSDPAQGLAAFARIGFADGRIYRLGSYTGGGLVYTGLFPGRDADQVGLAVAAAHNGDAYRQLNMRAGVRVNHSEVALELTYRAGLTKWLTVQPDFQYIINPGTVSGIDNAFLVNTRFEVSF
jgi:porin